MRGWPLQLGGRCTRARDREGGMSNPSDVEPAAGIPQPREPGRASTVPKLSNTSVGLPFLLCRRSCHAHEGPGQVDDPGVLAGRAHRWW